MNDLLRANPQVNPDGTLTLRFYEYLRDLEDSTEQSLEDIMGAISDLQDAVMALQQTFSWKTIPSDETITIAQNQQMIVADGITIDGDLIIEGELELI